MKRFNLLLPKNLDDYLENCSDKLDMTKAQFLRDSLNQKIKFGFPNNKSPFKQTWNLINNLSFDFQISDDQEKWLINASKIYSCTKGEIIRFILWLDLNHRYYKTEEVKENEQDNTPSNPIVENIKALLKLKDFSRLNSYLNDLDPTQILNLGEPEFFVRVIDEIQSKIKILPKLHIIKSKLLWFSGRTTESLFELDELGKGFDDNYTKFKAKLIQGEILTDMGISHKATEALKEAEELIDRDVQNWYLMKLNNKFGLSLFYIENLEKVKTYYEKSLSLAQTAEDKGTAHRYLGSVYHNMEDIEKAEFHFDQSFKYLSKSNDLDEYFRLLTTVSQLEITKLAWHKAKQNLEKAVEIAKKIKHIPNLSWALRILADVYFNLGEEEKAITMIDKSIEYGQICGGLSLLSKSYLRKAKYLIALNRPNEALEYLDMSRELEKKRIDKNQDYNSVSRWKNYINFVNSKDIHYSDLHKQTEILNRRNHHREEAVNDYVLGFLYSKSSDKAAAERGRILLKKVHAESMIGGNTQVQFAAEASLRFKSFVVV